MAAQPRIVLLHATPVAMEPVQTAFKERWPEARLVNLLDDALSPDRAAESTLTDKMVDRFVSFGRYAYSIGADGILVTCSAFGPAIDQMAAELPVPVLKPNEAMFHAAVAQGSRIGMIATFGPAVGTMTDEFEEYVAQKKSRATLKTVLVEEAMTALRKGDAVETVTLQRAVELLAERRAAGPAKPRRRAASAARAGTGRSAGTRRTGGGARRTGTSSPSRP